MHLVINFETQIAAGHRDKHGHDSNHAERRREFSHGCDDSRSLDPTPRLSRHLKFQSETRPLHQGNRVNQN